MPYKLSPLRLFVNNNWVTQQLGHNNWVTWTYSGLGIETHDSAEYRYVQG